jgi:hypothetical protein
MSLDKAFRDMIRAEVEAQLRPLQQAVRELQSGMGDVEQMRVAAEALIPLANVFSGGQLGQGGGRRGGSAARRVPAGGGRGRGKRAGAAAEAGEGSGGRKGGGRAKASEQECAIKGCGRPSRTKGYCAAHYQKLRMLDRRGQRPSAWADHASPNSVEDVKLPRGRAASKALKEARSS